MNSKRNPTLSEVTSNLASALIQCGPAQTTQPNWSVAMRPDETQNDAKRRVIAVHEKAIQRSLASGTTVEWPTWLKVSELASVGKVDSITAAMDENYKADRLNHAPGQREALIRACQVEFTTQGWVLLVSHHDAVTGRDLYLRQEAGALAVYMSKR
jgi:hypothetical protein